MSSPIKTFSILGLAATLLGVAVYQSIDPSAAQASFRDPAPAAPAEPAEASAPPKADGPRVQVALLLDTSGSMSGLIDQARTQLWKIVNRLSDSRRDGARPHLEIALFEYGNDSLPASSGWIRMVQPLTTDLDALSENLFGLTTNGGTELAGEAIAAATGRLNWADDEDALKIIFIAGNEEFDQGDLDPLKAIDAASKKGISVNTIYCGGSRDQMAAAWRSGAMLADGRFTVIDHNMRVAHVAAPQDAEIARLGMELNDTYVAFGTHGLRGSQRQAAQDQNVLKRRQGSVVQRAISKSSSYYKNTRWDLVDAVDDKKVDLGKLSGAQLPKEMRAMKAAERRAYVKKKKARRVALKAKIKALNVSRKKHIAAVKKSKAGKSNKSLDVAVLDMVESAASKKGFRFE